jgi:LemA protein
LAIVVVLGGWAASKYNTLQTKRENVRVRWSNIDSQLQRRADLIPNLVNTVKGYAKHEEKVFGDVAAARSRLLSAQTPEDKAAANDQLTGALGRLLALSENYPNLKADGQFQNLQFELAGTENRINVARTDYNQAVFDYNTTLQRFPTVVIARLLGFQRADEFKAAEGAREVPQVSF